MKRSGRWVRDALTVLSLLLCIATVAAWVRSSCVAGIDNNSLSYRSSPVAEADGELRIRWAEAQVDRGIISVGGGHKWYVPRPHSPQTLGGLAGSLHARRGWHFQFEMDMRIEDPPASAWNRLGLGFYVEEWALQIDGPNPAITYDPQDNSVTARWTLRCIALPAWLLTALTGLLPTLRLRGWRKKVRRSQRRARGLCPACGYDLRATLARCPECGTVPAAQGAA